MVVAQAPAVNSALDEGSTHIPVAFLYETFFYSMSSQRLKFLINIRAVSNFKNVFVQYVCLLKIFISRNIQCEIDLVNL